MAEDIKTDVVDPVESEVSAQTEQEAPTGEESQQSEAPAKSKYEEQALEMGWRPQTEWSGDPEDFVTAKEFVQRKSFFDKIATQNSEIKELKSVINKLSEHYNKVEDYTRKQVLTDLNNKKKAAYESGDAAEVARIDDAIMDFKLNEVELKRQKEVESQRKAGAPVPEVAEWQGRNSWYMKDQEMTDFVDTFTRGFLAQHPEAKDNPGAVLSVIDKEVRGRFPDKFKNSRRTEPSSVEGNGSTGKKPAAPKLEMSDAERRVAQKFVDRGTFKSIEEYVKALRKGDK